MKRVNCFLETHWKKMYWKTFKNGLRNSLSTHRQISWPSSSDEPVVVGSKGPRITWSSKIPGGEIFSNPCPTWMLYQTLQGWRGESSAHLFSCFGTWQFSVVVEDQVPRLSTPSHTPAMSFGFALFDAIRKVSRRPKFLLYTSLPFPLHLLERSVCTWVWFHVASQVSKCTKRTRNSLIRAMCIFGCWLVGKYNKSRKVMIASEKYASFN